MPIVSPQNHEEKQLEKMSDCALTEARHTTRNCFRDSNIDALRSAKDEVKAQCSRYFQRQTFAISEANNIASKTGLIGRLDAKFRKQTLGPSAGIDQSEQWSATFVRRVVYDDRDLLTQGTVLARSSSRHC